MQPSKRARRGRQHQGTGSMRVGGGTHGSDSNGERELTAVPCIRQDERQPLQQRRAALQHAGAARLAAKSAQRTRCR